MPELESILEFTRNIAEQAGDLIVGMRAHSRLNIQFKQDIELVTDADLASEKLITDAIKRRFPEHQILAEESNPDLSSVTYDGTPLWIIDPIDGTVNYAHHHTQVAVSIAYSIRGKVQVAVVYNPFQSEMFCAIRNQGAWLNDQPLTCSNTETLNRAIIATGFPYDKTNILPQLMNRLHKILENVADVRRLGSAALDICWVAQGRLDGYYESVSPWDFAAAQLIAKEAGAKVGHFIEPPNNIPVELYGENLLISNPFLYDELAQILQHAQLHHSQLKTKLLAARLFFYNFISR
jgi:myo-inositol-1(or 4)-monophosphatase